MVILGLLLIALACLVLGLVLQSAVWLVASLIATAGAGFLVFKLRDVIAAPKRSAPPEGLLAEQDPDSAVPEHARDTPSTVAAGDGVPAYDTAPELGAATGLTGGNDDEVWVIDGRPRYHLGDCAIIKGQDAEPISYEQATEDGFMPCSLCEPHAARIR